jgi:molybdenum cofactor biosynthesis enzyme MoaA
VNHVRPCFSISYLGTDHYIERCRHINEDSFGEPLGHPHFIDLVREVTARGQSFSFVTNGLLLSRRRADALVEFGPLLAFHVSFNAATQETYFKLHGKNFNQLLTNVRYYVSQYKQKHMHPPKVTATFIVMKINREEIWDFLMLARNLDIQALLAPLHDRPSVPLRKFGYDFVYEDEMLSPIEYRKIGEEARRFAADKDLKSKSAAWLGNAG